jgi:ParB family chromosome partitioning protein
MNQNPPNRAHRPLPQRAVQDRPPETGAPESRSTSPVRSHEAQPSLPTLDRSAGPDDFETRKIPLDLIDESDQLRLRIPPYQHIPELAENLRRKGQLAAMYVRANGDRFELISGYRRLTALKLNSAPTAFCRIFRGISDVQAYDIAVSENEDNDDLSILERAQICLRLQAEGRTGDEIAARFGWTNRRNVYHHYRLAKEASPALREALQQGGLSLHVALALIDAKAADLGEQLEREILKTVVEREMSVRETKSHVIRARQAAQPSRPDRATLADRYIRDHKNGAFTITARIDPQHPESLDVLIGAIETALKRTKQLKRKLAPKTEPRPEPDSKRKPETPTEASAPKAT